LVVSQFVYKFAGKFYCVDAGYTNCLGYLSPDRGIKYPRPPFRKATLPKGIKETFNHVHSKVRNVVERSFGVLKNKFRILKGIPQFTIAKQTRIIVACMAIHNFIRDSKLDDKDFDLCDADENYTPLDDEYDSEDELELNTEGEEPLTGDADMDAFRDQIAYALFYK
jgi:hypothetical protein